MMISLLLLIRKIVVDLKEGVTTIGRGSANGLKYTRISRNHGKMVMEKRSDHDLGSASHFN